MRQLHTFAVCLLLLTGGLLLIQDHGASRAPFAPDRPDLVVTINTPENGGRYQAELGLKVNVTLENIGLDMGSSRGNLSLIVRSQSTGEIVKSWIPIPFTGIKEGESIDLTFSNWTQAFAGRFICNVSALFFNDHNMSDNYAEHTFSVFSENFPGPPKLDPKPLDEVRGDTSTVFEFRSDFSYNKMPAWVRIELDGKMFDMDEEDPEDDIPNDGKIFVYRSTLSIGNHRFRFKANVTDYGILTTPYTNNPWVNLSLRDANVTPLKGYVTTPFLFTVNYGSDKNLAPDRIFVDLGSKKFNLTAPGSANYLSGNVQFSTKVNGIDLIPSPLTYRITCQTDNDLYTIGPFKADGPRMDQVNLTGRVTDLEGTALEGVAVTITPGGSTLTDQDGAYKFVSYVGRKFQISYSKQGYYTRSYELDLMEDRALNIELEPLPAGGTVKGYVQSSLGGQLGFLEGATVQLNGEEYSGSTSTDVGGFYMFEEVPAGTGYILKVTEYKHQETQFTLNVGNGEIVVRNVTLLERDMGVVMDPVPSDEAIGVDQIFRITFPELPDLSSVMIVFENSTSSVPVSFNIVPNTTIVELVPSRDLNYNTHYTITLNPGVEDPQGNLLVWRGLSWSFMTEMQAAGPMYTDPAKDALDVPLDQVITISFGIGLNHSTVKVNLYLDQITTLPLDVEYVDTVDWNDSGRTDTFIRITCDNLTYLSSYVLTVSTNLRDIYGRPVITDPFSLEFTTEKEPDRDGDGHPDSEDVFPDDPNEWYDSDGDGRGDNSDAFPSDVNEWSDTDGDGKGDNSDDDDDGDGMPDQWELDNGFDPLDPGDAFLDADNDGYSNLEEYLEGTDPNDEGDHPEEAGISINLIILISAIVIILILVIVVMLYMFGLLGKRKEEPFPEE
ncbi:MAG: Ig-like domain-containing protein [Thermoplasmatota archaeon]